MHIETEKHYQISIGLSQTETNQLLDELEDVFIAYARTNEHQKIQKISELKNLLTLSLNNVR